jgi:hypothetical protein
VEIFTREFGQGIILISQRLQDTERIRRRKYGVTSMGKLLKRLQAFGKVDTVAAGADDMTRRPALRTVADDLVFLGEYCTS